jgi:WD40 repeat protein
MKTHHSFHRSFFCLTARFGPATLLGLLCFGALTVRGADVPKFQPNPNSGPGDVIVHGKFGGNIFGFEVDPNGTEGLLCEALLNPDGTVTAAVETFDQATGRIIRVLSRTNTQDDFIAWSVAGSIGLFEHEKVKGIFDIKRTFSTINPLSGNQVNGNWTPPIERKQIVNQVKAALDGSPNVAVYALSVSTSLNPVVFTSNLSDNTFSPAFEITDLNFITEAPPIIAFDPVGNQVILGHDKPSPFIEPPLIGFLDLATGSFEVITGLGLGVINGVAVDAEDRILCTDTSFDSAVQFYDLNDLSGISVLLPGHDPQTSTASGADIEFDPINKLFLVAQEFFNGSLTDGSGIQVYDLAGNLVESIDGLNFQGGFNVFPIHITLNPSRRMGFVNGPDLTTAIQSFSY